MLVLAAYTGLLSNRTRLVATSMTCSTMPPSRVQAVPALRLIGTAPDKASVLTFALAGCTPDDVASELDRCGIAVRAGHRCAQPILRRYGLEADVRPSLAMYNTRAEIDQLAAALHKIAASAGNR